VSSGKDSGNDNSMGIYEVHLKLKRLTEVGLLDPRTLLVVASCSKPTSGLFAECPTSFTRPLKMVLDDSNLFAFCCRVESGVGLCSLALIILNNIFLVCYWQGKKKSKKGKGKKKGKAPKEDPAVVSLFFEHVK
jgi:hypothetical protein